MPVHNCHQHVRSASTAACRHFTTVLVTAVLVLTAEMASADGFVASSHSEGLYDGNEWSQLLRSVATIVVILAAANDDDIDDNDAADYLCDDPYDHDYYYDPDSLCDELGVTVPQVQFSAGMGYALSRLTVGAMYLFRQDLNHNDILRLWGGGPEVTLKLSNFDSIQPFIGGYFLFARAEPRWDRGNVAKGTSLGLRAGIDVMLTEGVGLVLQSGFQRDRFPLVLDVPLRSRGTTVGLGLRVALE